MTEPSDSTRGQLVRFLIAGAANTALTGGALALLATVMNPAIAYTIVFVAGIALGAVLAGRFVFRQRLTLRNVVAYVLLYLAVYLVGLLVVRSLHAAGAPEWATGLVVLVTAPLSFLGARIVFRGRG